MSETRVGGSVCWVSLVTILTVWGMSSETSLLSLLMYSTAELSKVKLKSRDCLHAFTLRNNRALRVRLPYAAPGCSQFLDRSEHTCGTRAQQEDSVGLEPTTSEHLRVWRCRLYRWAISYSFYPVSSWLWFKIWNWVKLTSSSALRTWKRTTRTCIRDKWWVRLSTSSVTSLLCRLDLPGVRWSEPCW